MFISQGLPYNMESVTHYYSHEYSRNNQPTIVPLDYSISLSTFGRSKLPNFYDYLHIRLLYCGGEKALFILKQEF